MSKAATQDLGIIVWTDTAAKMRDGASRFVKARSEGMAIIVANTVRVKKAETRYVFKMFTEAKTLEDAKLVIDINRAQFKWDDPDTEVVAANTRLKGAKHYVLKGIGYMVDLKLVTADDAKAGDGYKTVADALKAAKSIGGFWRGLEAEVKKADEGSDTDEGSEADEADAPEETEAETEAREHNEAAISNRPPVADDEPAPDLPEELAAYLAAMIDAHREQEVFTEAMHTAYEGYMTSHVRIAHEAQLRGQREQAERDAAAEAEAASQAATDEAVAEKKAEKKAA